MPHAMSAAFSDVREIELIRDDRDHVVTIVLRGADRHDRTCINVFNDLDVTPEISITESASDEEEADI